MLNPDQFGETINVSLTGETPSGRETLQTLEYSVAKYCCNQIKNSSDVNLKKLCASILEFGDAAEKYVGKTTGDRVLTVAANDSVSGETISGLTGGIGPRAITSVSPMTSGTAGACSWKAAGLNLTERIMFRFTMSAADDAFDSVVITADGKTYTIPKGGETAHASMVKENGQYVVYFDGLDPSQMDVTVNATPMKDGAAVGKTLHYSVDTYVSRKLSAGGTLATLLNKMEAYGNAAKVVAAAS